MNRLFHSSRISLSNLADRYVNSESKIGGGIENSFLKKIQTCIYENIPNENFSVIDLAQAVHISVSQLNRKLKQLINCTAGKLIRMIRMKFAASLLKDQSMRIGEVAFLTGFKDQAHFCRNFKQEFEQTPSEYQQIQSSVIPTKLRESIIRF